MFDPAQLQPGVWTIEHEASSGFGQPLQVQREVLDECAAKLDVGVADPPSYLLLVAAGQRQHVGIAVHADHPPFWAHELREDVTGFARPRAQIDDRVGFTHVRRGIATTVVPLEDLLGDGVQVLLAIGDRTAEGLLRLSGCLRITPGHG